MSVCDTALLTCLLCHRGRRVPQAGNVSQPLSVKVDATASIKLQHCEAVPERVQLAGCLQPLESKQQLRECVGERLWQKLRRMRMQTASDRQRGRSGCWDCGSGRSCAACECTSTPAFCASAAPTLVGRLPVPPSRCAPGSDRAWCWRLDTQRGNYWKQQMIQSFADQPRGKDTIQKVLNTLTHTIQQ